MCRGTDSGRIKWDGGALALVLSWRSWVRSSWAPAATTTRTRPTPATRRVATKRPHPPARRLTVAATPAARSRRSCSSERLDGVGDRRRDRQAVHRGEPRQRGRGHRDRREHDVRRTASGDTRRGARVLAVGHQRRRAEVHRRRHRRRDRRARRDRPDRLVRARLRARGAPRAGDVGGLQGPRGRQAVRDRRDRRQGPFPRHRPVVLAGRRGDHHQPRPAVPGRLLGFRGGDVAELDSKVAAHEPIVMYWWTPTAAAGKYNLKKVELPEYTDECYADPATPSPAPTPRTCS